MSLMQIIEKELQSIQATNIEITDGFPKLVTFEISEHGGVGFALGYVENEFVDIGCMVLSKNKRDEVFRIVLEVCENIATESKVKILGIDYNQGKEHLKSLGYDFTIKEHYAVKKLG